MLMKFIFILIYIFIHILFKSFFILLLLLFYYFQSLIIITNEANIKMVKIVHIFLYILNIII